MSPLSEGPFADFYRQHARPVWTYVYRVTGNAADADDIVQEAFIRVFNADLPSLTADEMRKYLFRVAGNLMADRWRRSTREQAKLQQLRDAEPPVAVVPADDDVARTLAMLKPRERALLWLAYVEGEDHERIAQSLGVGRGSVKVLFPGHAPACGNC